MYRHGRTSCLVLVAALAASPLAAQLSSNSKNVAAYDCSGLKLAAAGGVPDGPAHSYKFHGPCQIVSFNFSSDEVAGFTVDTDKEKKVLATVWTVAAVKWDKSSGQMIEHVKTAGAYAGEISMVLKCGQDPVITSAVCIPVSYDNETSWPGFDLAWTHARPLTRGKTNLSEASAFSKKSESSGPPAEAPPPAKVPPPKAKPPVARLPKTTTAAAAPVSVLPVQPSKPGHRAVIPVIPDPQELSLSLRTLVRLESGRSLGVRQERDGLHWVILSERGEVMRLFPQRSRAYRSSAGKVTVDWGGGVYEAGIAVS